MLNRLSQCLAVFAHSMSQLLELDQPATIGSTTLQGGHYDLQAIQIQIRFVS